MAVDKEKLDSILKRVQKPARYLGGEWNTVHKDHRETDVSMAFAFPDLYEVGMSNQGLKILYGSVNSRPGLLLERVFAPAVDMEELMRAAGLPLFSLESLTPLREFDVVGFSLQYELSYTNVLNMLDLGAIPLYSEQRREDDPLVIGGGPCAYNPEPLAPFFDLFVVGEAEEALPELLAEVARCKKQRAGRRETVATLSALDGVYVPACYRPLYREDRFSGLEKLCSSAPARVEKRAVADLDSAFYPADPVVPFIQVVHDRAVVELFRGCARGCRFCQAGHVFRPLRRRSPEKIIEMAEAIIRSTGYDELSLASLSSSDYPQLDSLIERIDRVLSAKRVRCSLPSLRLDSYSVRLADRLHRGKRSSLTFAPEAATERLRRVIGKSISDDDIFNTLEDALGAGWQGFKLYFMIGLPTEQVADVEAIVELCSRIRQHFRRLSGRAPALTVSVSTFVPKAHTPFQWEPQLPLQSIHERQQLLRSGFKKIPGIGLSWHEAEASLLEAVFARGDRRLAPLVAEAWRLGCRFDGWSEYFSFSPWKRAFENLGLDPADFAYRRFDYEDGLPWDHIDCGYDREDFERLHRAAQVECSANGGEQC